MECLDQPTYMSEWVKNNAGYYMQHLIIYHYTIHIGSRQSQIWCLCLVLGYQYSTLCNCTLYSIFRTVMVLLSIYTNEDWKAAYIILVRVYCILYVYTVRDVCCLVLPVICSHVKIVYTGIQWALITIGSKWTRPDTNNARPPVSCLVEGVCWIWLSEERPVSFGLPKRALLRRPPWLGPTRLDWEWDLIDLGLLEISLPDLTFWSGAF